MSADACTRTWEADALADCRLGEADRASFERHQRSCAPCRGRAKALRDLDATMAELPCDAALPLAHQRARASLLREANRRATTPPLPLRGLVLAAVAGSLAVAFAVALPRRAARPPQIEAVREEATPRTDRGGDGIELLAGDTWSPAEARPEPSLTDRPRGIVGAAESRDGARRPTGQPAEASRSGAHFVRAMAAYEAGDYAYADALFAAFGRAYPGDARAEDAAFLRAIAHERMGDPSGAAALASAYLERFPGGLRAAEARSWLDAGRGP